MLDFPPLDGQHIPLRSLPPFHHPNLRAAIESDLNPCDAVVDPVGLMLDLDALGLNFEDQVAPLTDFRRPPGGCVQEG